jgi:hypothetical protein
LNPKKKIFEAVQPDLLVDDKHVATFKNSPLVVGSLGPVTVQSLIRANIK